MLDPEKIKITPKERKEILELLGGLADMSLHFKKLHEKAVRASDAELFVIVNSLEDEMLKSEQEQKKKVKTVADTLTIESALCDAAEKGDIGLMEYLIQKGVSVNDMGMMNTTPLFAAIQKNQKLAVAFLLSQKDTDVNYISGGGNTPLMAACRLGHEKIVAMLLADPRTDVNKKSPNGSTALHNAAAMGHINLVKKLLAVPGIELSAEYTEKNHSALSLAKQNGHAEIAQIIETHKNSQAKPQPPQ